MRLLILSLLALTLWATPTRTTMQTFTQSDGSTFEGRLRGDAFAHWIEASDGSVLLFNKENATFEYALIEEGRLQSSGEAYKAAKTRRAKAIDPEALRTLWEHRRDVKADQIPDASPQ
ncbi:MAG: hypothetical protein JXK05_12015 [Campylobacterales bacterium]|nr:hypothetical protein [Campylobacterales bacterium]